MPQQINVTYKVEDGRGKRILSSLQERGKDFAKLGAVSVVDSYTIEGNLSKKDLTAVADVLHEPLSEKVAINKPLAPKEFAYAIEIGFLPGVTDNVGATTRETIANTLKCPIEKAPVVYCSQTFFLVGAVSKKAAEAAAASLHNPLIQRATIKSAAQFKKDKGMGITIPKVKLEAGQVSEVDLYVSDEELIKIGSQGIASEDGTRRGPLGLGLDELKVIRSYFHRQGRLPTDIEIEALAQTWSEHCKHTIFANPMDEITDGIYKHYIKRATKEVRKKKGKNDFCISVFSDDSGVIEFDKDRYITHKVETHNSPSALDPFGGAITGIVGVNRDCIGTGMGAHPLLNMYGFCFADPADKTRLWRDKDRTQELLSSRRILDGVVDGVNAGGNQSGIPTPQGFTYFEPRYRGKPLVFVGTVGVLPKKVMGEKTYDKSANVGDLIVMVGGRVGLDGIHGVTFASVALDKHSPATAVQIGDAITQKKLSDAIIKEARDQGLYTNITDNGGGGLSSSVGEMAEDPGGCEVWLDKVPVKYAGLAPWQIWISESQERMTLAVPKKHWDKLKALMDARGVEATVIGEFTDSGRCVLNYKEKTVADLSMDFMHDGDPVNVQITKEPVRVLTNPAKSALSKAEYQLDKTLLSLLAEANLASTEFISNQYDHEVQGASVTKPLQGKGRVSATASVSRPDTKTKKGIVLSQGLTPRYSDIDTYHMAASAIDQAVRNVVAVGADPKKIALLDNFCWCSSNEPERLYELKEAARACYEYAVAYEAPFISGKDSMFNDFKGFDAKGKPVKISVPPTLLVSSIATMENVAAAVTLDFKQSGHAIYLLGETKAELGGGEYLAWLGKQEKKTITGTSVPTVDANKNNALYQKYHKALQKGLVASAVALDRAGLAGALIKSTIGGQLGAAVDLSKVSKKLSVSEILFSESNGRILVSVPQEKRQQFEKAMKGTTSACIGVVADTESLMVMDGQKELTNIPLQKLTTAYRSKFKNF